MKQIWIPRSGPPEILEVRDGPVPEPKPGEVRIHVKASGLNFADLSARIGIYPDAPPFPTVVGYEVSGLIDKVGEGVTELKGGERVLALTHFGGHSEMVVVPTSQVHIIPENISFEKAAAIPVNYLTAWLMLVHLGNVREKDLVLVHAVAGGVGQAALQICQLKGAQVIGTASASKHAKLKELGVVHCIDYNTQDFEKEVLSFTKNRGVDIALDAVGGKSFSKSYRSLASMGRLFLFGASSLSSGRTRSLWKILKGLWQMPRFRSIPLMHDNKGVFGVNLGHLWNRTEDLKKMLVEIGRLTSEGKLDPVVDKVFPFEEAAQAHEYMTARKNFGKVLLAP